ncbi:MAG TPA: acylphosphatase [Thermodesulfovibrionales bacterium]|nr:acylphosphatase [Thermodesulfovibrionales bacterium]
MKKAKAHLYIDGRVQGVFFRGFVQELAERLGVKGWVRNLRDGRVEAAFEGDKEAIENAIMQCNVGPPASRVTNLDVQWEIYTGDEQDFSVRQTL